MRETLYQFVEGLITRLKGKPYHLDRAIPLDVLLGMLTRRAIWLSRGILKGLILQRRIALVFMADGVNLRSASLIRFGRGVTLERGVTIDGLMRDGITLGDNVRLGPYTTMIGPPPFALGDGIRMGHNSAADAYSFIGGGGPVLIGNNVIMGEHVSFHPVNHKFDQIDIPIRDQGTSRKGIIIEDDVWVGANATFLDGAHVGRGSVIGAGSIVRGEIPPYSVAVGTPAKVIRSRVPQSVMSESSATSGAR
jgi:acetyltransferase-like isoleucine patch superfamily enzyme